MEHKINHKHIKIIHPLSWNTLIHFSFNKSLDFPEFLLLEGREGKEKEEKEGKKEGKEREKKKKKKKNFSPLELQEFEL